MLNQYLTIDGVTLPNPNPGTFTWRYNPDENSYTSEAGTLLNNVRRLNRISWSGQFNCSSAMAATLQGYCLQASVTCTINGVSHEGMLRLGGDITLYENSEYTAGTDGLWIVPLTFEEF